MVATQEQRLLDAETRRVHDDLAAASRRARTYGLNSMKARPWRPRSESAPGPLEQLGRGDREGP